MTYEFNSEEEAILALKEEGQRLIRIARRVWNSYLRSYDPSKYVRTHDSEMSMILSNVVKIDKDTLGLRLNFLDDLAYHDSVLNGKNKGKYPQGHSIMLISEGWHSKKLEDKIGERYMFTYYEGFDYLEKVREEFEKGKHMGISFEIYWNGKPFGKKPKQENVLKKK